MPSRAKPAAAPRPWRREEGRYRSADDRFTIEGGGSGRWFVTDGEHQDELGLARTLGPFATLDDAKRAANEQRLTGSDVSPLAARLEAAATSPGRVQRPRAGHRPRTAPRRSATDENERPGTVAAEQPETTARPPTWLDELADDDREQATRARRMIAALEELGVADADALVRRDVLGRQPAIATRLVGRALAAALAAALDAGTMQREASAASPAVARLLSGADREAVASYGVFVAGRVLAATLEVLTSTERADGAGRALPGWSLVERPGHGDDDVAPRRLLVGVGDVTEG